MSIRPVEIELSHAKKWTDAHNEASNRFFQTSSPENRLIPLGKLIVTVAKTSRLILIMKIIYVYTECREVLISL
jgi:hypothetical protein